MIARMMNVLLLVKENAWLIIPQGTKSRMIRVILLDFAG